MNTTNTLKLKRRKSPRVPEAIDKLIKRSVARLRKGKIKASVSDLVRAVHLRRKLFPVTPEKRPTTWVDYHSQRT